MGPTDFGQIWVFILVIRREKQNSNFLGLAGLHRVQISVP
jgi:hypothetical protein